MKKLLLALSLLTANAYACSAACDAARAAAEAAAASETSECLLSDTLCYEFTDDSTGKYGLMDKDDNISVPAKYDYISVAYYEGYSEYAPYLRVETKENNEIYSGLLDEKGKVLFMGDYDRITPTKYGLAIVYKSGMYGLIDFTGKTILPTTYENIKVSDTGMIIATQIQYTLIDHKGKQLTQYPYIVPLTNDKAMFCELSADKGLKCGIMDKAGKIIMLPTYSDFKRPYNYTKHSPHQMIWAVNDDNKYGLIDSNTGKAKTPFKYDEVDDFYEGIAIVSVDDKYGFIDENGKEVIKPIYDYAYGFDAGLAKVEKDGEWFYIDKTGKRVP